MGKFRLDRTGDDIDRGALGRHDQVDAGRARHLGEALDGALDLLAGDHHQIGHLVDDDDDIGQLIEAHLLLFEDRLPGLAVESGLDRAGDHRRRGRSASATRALKPSMLRTPIFDILR